MEDIIGFLVIVAALIFKVVGNRLDKAQTKGKPAPDAAPAEVFPQQEIFKVPVKPQEQVTETKADVPVRQKKYVPVNEAQRQIIRPAVKPVVEKQERKREKIDPKKLIVYSEIMNRKY